VFVDEILIKNLTINKQNQGGHYISTMSPIVALFDKHIALMWHRFKLMSLYSHTWNFEWFF